MSVKVFAPMYSRTQEGWINFPRDAKLRHSLFIPESLSHPAKMNLHLLQAIIDFVTEPGDKLLDPMSGTGSLMLATLPPSSCSVYLIEDAPVYHYMQTLSKDKFLELGVPDSSITLLQGPCQDYLPMQGFFDHVIFSPPYANVMSAPAGKLYAGGFHDQYAKQYEDYKGASNKNLGRMSTFFYNQEAAKVYKLLLDSLRQGGTMTVVVQDKISGGKREGLSDWVMRACIRAGFELLFWEKRYSTGSGMKNLLRSKGFTVVEEEDVIGFKKP